MRIAKNVLPTKPRKPELYDLFKLKIKSKDFPIKYSMFKSNIEKFKKQHNLMDSEIMIETTDYFDFTLYGKRRVPQKIFTQRMKEYNKKLNIWKKKEKQINKINKLIESYRIINYQYNEAAKSCPRQLLNRSSIFALEDQIKKEKEILRGIK